MLRFLTLHENARKKEFLKLFASLVVVVVVVVVVVTVLAVAFKFTVSCCTLNLILKRCAFFVRNIIFDDKGLIKFAIFKI